MRISLNRWTRWTVVLAASLNICGSCAAAGRTEIDLSGRTWRMWLDEKSSWKDDELYPPPVDVSKLPVNLPTGGWAALGDKAGQAVSVPGTVEQYLGTDDKGDFRNVDGVSWWWRYVEVPAAGRAILQFQAAKMRAEVFWDEKLVGYDVVGNTPFEVDLGANVKAGLHTLAVRLTDPGGNFAWEDFDAQAWGKHKIPATHGFGGLTGAVKLVLVDSAYVQDVFVANKPRPRDIDVQVTVRNASGSAQDGELTVRVRPAGAAAGKQIAKQTRAVRLGTGQAQLAIPISCPDAQLWTLERPSLYDCEVSLRGKGFEDLRTVRFGFRWFAPDGVGKDACFRLNGKRIVLRSAISWGYWPTNGVFPGPELAAKQVCTAKELGLNMLSFHRCIGPPSVLDQADTQGLLYYEEPGGYVCNGGDELAYRLAREKLLRMVLRDRSHPSLVIYNMINEQAPEKPLDRHKADMRDAHALDPTRTITFVSDWSRPLHMRPMDDKQYASGWWDYHNACGYDVYCDELYKGPADFLRRTEIKDEIVYWGEEGATSTPPRLQLIHDALVKMPVKGWDGPTYLRWFKSYDDFLAAKYLRKDFPTVDSLTLCMGDIAHYYQARIIENARIGDLTDGYVINGWESELFDNHSGIVDCFRNPKGDPKILAYYNQPLYVAIKARHKVFQIPDQAVVDFYAINEKDLRGPHKLVITLKDPAGKTVARSQFDVSLDGGDVYGQLLKADVKLPVEQAAGMFTVEASLLDGAAKPVAQGREELLAVDWKGDKLADKGAIVDCRETVANFLRKEKGLNLPDLSRKTPPVDWIVWANAQEGQAIAPQFLRPAKGTGPGLSAEIFAGKDFKQSLCTRVDPKVDFDWDGVAPDPRVKQTENYCIRWEGKVVPPADGTYVFYATDDDGVRLWVDGKKIIDEWTDHGATAQHGTIDLKASKPVDIRLEYFQGVAQAVIRLAWKTPLSEQVTPQDVLHRVKNDGTTLIVLTDTPRWAQLLADAGAIKFTGTLEVGSDWLGGEFFVRRHPLFEGLPTNTGMNWPYQELVRKGRIRYGLYIQGEELAAGCVSTTQPPATAVGVVRYGKGKVILSTLDIAGALAKPDGQTINAVKKIVCNCIRATGTGQ